MKALKRGWGILSVILILSCNIGLVACGDDEDEGAGNAPENLFGTWSGSGDSRSVSVTFNRDGTGTEEMEFSSAYSRYGAAAFTYTFKSNQIKCTGTWTDVDSEGETSTKSWSKTYEYYGNSISSGYSNVPKLTK